MVKKFKSDFGKILREKVVNHKKHCGGLGSIPSRGMTAGIFRLVVFPGPVIVRLTRGGKNLTDVRLTSHKTDENISVCPPKSP